MTDNKIPLKEGLEKKGGVNKPPKTQKQPIKPPKQKPRKK